MQSAALAERSRLARDMHDVLAHSLSALALQLEGARLLARDRDTDPEVVAAVERAHHLAADGLGEARAAIGALRGDEMPGPERLRVLAEGFGDRAAADRHRRAARARLRGAARDLPHRPGGADQRRAPQRRRQRRAAARLRAAAGTRLTVEDSGAGVPVPAGPSPGGGYGITGMRERAELLGGRLDAGPDRARLPRRAVAAGMTVRVLLADDQRVVREGLGTLLGLLDGIELVGTAADGAEAVELARRHDPDVVLMDLRMPRVDGIEAIRRLPRSAIARARSR